MDVLKVLIIVQTFAASSVVVLGEDKKVCNNNLKHYEELKCIPVTDQQTGCIVSYDCSSIAKQKKDKCYYQGKEFSFGDKLNSSEILSNCLAECRCLNGNGRGNFNCANIECPELFDPSIEQGCVRTYSHDSCCSIGENCKDKEGRYAGATCEYKGEVLMEGQNFYPTEEPCKKCICKPGFNGTLVSPYCEDIVCEMELHYADYIAQGCTPVYFGEGDKCCPISWHCPNANDTIVKEDVEKDKPTVKNKDGGPKCKFGNLEMEIGQRLAPTIRDKCVECSCKVPPFLSCAINMECYNKN